MVDEAGCEGSGYAEKVDKVLNESCRILEDADFGNTETYRDAFTSFTCQVFEFLSQSVCDP